MCRHENDRINSSGCADITAYEAIKNVRREVRRRLISELKALAKKGGNTVVISVTDHGNGGMRYGKNIQQNRQYNQNRRQLKVLH